MRPPALRFPQHAMVYFRHLAGLIDKVFTGVIRGNLKLGNVIALGKGRTMGERINSLHLTRRVLNLFGGEHLVAIDKHPSKRPSFAWPALYLAGKAGNVSVTAELLLLTTFRD